MIPYAVLIQARMSSQRTPAKVAHLMEGSEMLHHQLMRLKQLEIPVFVITSDDKSDDKVGTIAKKTGTAYFRGDLHNVLKRYVDAAEYWQVKNVIRVGGDDPLIDPEGIIRVIEVHQKHQTNLVYSSHKLGWIYGTACELIETSTLKHALYEATNDSDKEHVVSYIKRNTTFSIQRVYSPKELCRPDIYVSVDYMEDLQLIEQILQHFVSQNKLYSFTQAELIELYDSGLLNINNKHLHTGFDD